MPSRVGHAVETRQAQADRATWKLDSMTMTQKGSKAARLAYTLHTLLRAYFGLGSPKGSGCPMDSDLAEVPAASFPDGRRCDRVLNALLIRYFLTHPAPINPHLTNL